MYKVLSFSQKINPEKSVINAVEILKTEIKNSNLTGCLNVRSIIHNKSVMNRVCETLIVQSANNSEFFTMVSEEIKKKLSIPFTDAKNNTIKSKVLSYRNEDNVRISANVVDYSKFEKLQDAFMLICTTGPFIPTTKFRFPEKLSAKLSLQVILGILFCEFYIDGDIHKPELIEYFKASVPAMVEFGVRVKIETLNECKEE